jgi:N-acetylglucosaminyldiphosphoundecaprenol N-acetyl-beta-D-mannosaminyltransferase
MTMSELNPPLVVIGAITVHDIDPPQTDRTIQDWLACPGPSRTVCTPNVDYVVRAGRDTAFRDAILDCDLRVPDGMWIVYASRLAGRPVRTSVTGRLLLPRLAAYCRSKGLRIVLVGAGPGVAADAASRLIRDLPGLTVAAAISPPMNFQIGSQSDDAIVAEIVEAAPAIVFVALGAPKQETWMAVHREELAPAVLIGVGQAFDVVAGRVREAPGWMTRVGLEWAFRLVQEPRRLARRYIVDDPWILLWAVRTRMNSWIQRARST